MNKIKYILILFLLFPYVIYGESYDLENNENTQVKYENSIENTIPTSIDIDEDKQQNEIKEKTYLEGVFDSNKIDRRKYSIDTFKDELYNNIFFSNDISLSNEDLENFKIDKRNDIYKRILNDVINKTNQYEDKRDNLINRSNSLKDTIEIIDNDIMNTSRKINELNSGIIEMVRGISKTREEIEELNILIKESRDLLLDYIAHIYKKYNLISDKEDIDTIRTILLNSDNLSSVLSELYYSQVIEVAGQMLINDYRALMKDLFLNRKNLEQENKKLREMRLEEITNKEMLEQKRGFRERILEITQGQEEKYREYLERQTKIEKAIKSRVVENHKTIQEHKIRLKSEYNCDIIDSSGYENHEILFNENDFSIYDEYLSIDSDNEDIISKKEMHEEFCSNFNKVLSNEIKLIQSNFNNKLLWPILPERGLSAYYQDSGYEKVVGTSHDAIDIRANQGTEIISPADGYVIYVKPPIDESYSYFAVKHSNGFVTVYGHVNEIYVDLYDFVNIGDIIAKSGGAIGTNGAGIMTSGPHLHFELFKDGEYVDPLDYLDLTYLGVDNLPPKEKYVYNFLSDFRNKFGYNFDGEINNQVNIFKLEGDTEIERQKFLLNTYATPVFRNWDMWVEESLAGSIDPSFIMCIGLAESGLGRALKTPYNVGNVGNTDSGSTWDLPNARSGVYWIVRTLNNRFLSDYNTMNQLSRYGNPDGAIYASSPENWQRNIVRCLSALKGKHVHDKFEFRINN